MRRVRTSLTLAACLAWPSSAGASMVSPVEEYEAGAAKYESGDFRAAIEMWENARGQMQDAPPRARALMELNLATAYEKAYDADGDRAALETAATLTRSFISRAPSAFEADEVAVEQQRGRERLARIEGKLAQPVAAVPPPAIPPAPGPQTGDPTPQDKPAKPGRGMIAGGATSLGIGAVGLGVMTAGLVMASRANDFSDVDPTDLDAREAQIQRGNRANAMAVSGLIIGAVAVPVGAVLVGLGAKRRKSAAAASAHVAPVMAPGHAGLQLRGKF